MWLHSGLDPLLQSGVQFRATKVKMLSRCDNQLIDAYRSPYQVVRKIHSFENQGKLLTYIGRCWVCDHQKQNETCEKQSKISGDQKRCKPSKTPAFWRPHIVDVAHFACVAGCVKAQTSELITCHRAPHLHVLARSTWIMCSQTTSRSNKISRFWKWPTLGRNESSGRNPEWNLVSVVDTLASYQFDHGSKSWSGLLLMY